MSLYGALDTAISGLTAQAGAFGNISDNVANSQSVGFKRVDTAFLDYLTTSTQSVNESGAVVARPDYVNTVQGSITQTDNPLGLAIGGSGFFAASERNGSAAGKPTFNPQTYFTRAGDFQQDKNGFLVNSAGLYLNGWAADPATGAVNRNALAPIRVSQAPDQPQATGAVSLSANLPASPASGTPVSSQVEVYDSLGAAHVVTLGWTKTAADKWTVNVSSPTDASGTADRGSADVVFGGALSDGSAAPDGTPGKVSVDGADAGTVTVDPAAGGAGTQAAFTFKTDFGNGPQAITINLGTFARPDGTTQYAGTQYNLRGLTQDGAPPGAYTGVTVQTTGDVVVNYDNGQSRTIARVPVVTFGDADKLQRQNGQAFTATNGSGAAVADDPAQNGAGSLVTSSVEGSNVDVASELSKLIVAQRAYSANAKIVTSADELLQVTLDMKR